jgi:hypothetical protein
MKLHQIKKILQSKESNYQSEETAYRIGENLCQLVIWKEINIQNI